VSKSKKKNNTVKQQSDEGILNEKRRKRTRGGYEHLGEGSPTLEKEKKRQTAINPQITKVVGDASE